MSNTPSPFDPITIGPLTLRNRFIKSGANEAMSRNGVPTKALLKHHRDLAAGGVGMTTVAYIAVAEIGRTLNDQIWIRREILPDLRALTDAIHAEGAAISAQITHGGSFVTSIKVDGPTMSSSAGINKAGLFQGNIFKRAMNEDDMTLVIGQFVEAAKLAREAGFDAVEIHMGHGYMLNARINTAAAPRTAPASRPAC
jgi:2,4-dienoyl-CoA reductase-like NADH-dependent reductase (Old Yellow Enzyme family)